MVGGLERGPVADANEMAGSLADRLLLAGAGAMLDAGRAVAAGDDADR